MTYQPEIITIHLGIPHSRGDGNVIGGQNYTDDEGHHAVRLFLKDDGGERYVHLREGQGFEFASSNWTVSKVFEPTSGSRGSVVTVTKVP